MFTCSLHVFALFSALACIFQCGRSHPGSTQLFVCNACTSLCEFDSRALTVALCGQLISYQLIIQLIYLDVIISVHPYLDVVIPVYAYLDVAVRLTSLPPAPN